MRIKDLEAFRAEVRAFLDENLTPELRDAAALQAGVYSEGDVCRSWHRILYKKGWVAPSWPEKYGGPGWTPIQRMIFESECAAAGAPILPGMSILMCGPVLIRFGTEEQKSFFLPRILSGVAAGKTFDLAFIDATGTTVRGATRLFWRSSGGWEEWITFVASPFTLWTLITSLALAAIWRHRLRRAERRRRWEAEEALDTDPWDDHRRDYRVH